MQYDPVQKNNRTLWQDGGPYNRAVLPKKHIVAWRENVVSKKCCIHTGAATLANMLARISFLSD